LKAVLAETSGFLLFEGVTQSIEHETKEGFTWTTLKLTGGKDGEGSGLELKAKNEFLIALRNGKPIAVAPDIITAVRPENCTCIPAEKIVESSRLVVLGIPAPRKWRSPKGLELWREMMQRSGINEKYVPVERLASKA